MSTLSKGDNYGWRKLGVALHESLIISSLDDELKLFMLEMRKPGTMQESYAAFICGCANRLVSELPTILSWLCL